MIRGSFLPRTLNALYFAASHAGSESPTFLKPIALLFTGINPELLLHIVPEALHDASTTEVLPSSLSSGT
jgi:hypothetical protein